jgi:hypothetical protein
MKQIVDRAKQLSRTMAGRLRRAVDPPLAPDAAPLEIRHFIVEAIEARVQPTGGGRRRLPDSLVEVKIVAADPAGQRALRSTLVDLQSAVLARLKELSCEVPAGFAVHVAYLKRAPAGWPADQLLAIDYSQPGAAASVPPSGTPALTLTVVRGSAAQPAFTFTVPIVRVGRSPAPHDDRGRARRNDVAFLEDGNDESMTVTRGHCEIRYNRAGGGYRIFDERSANGTRIVRGGEVIEVPAGDPIGVAIMDGDELQFGNAAVRVSIGER